VSTEPSVKQPLPAVGQQWYCTTETGTRTVTVTSVWEADDGHTAVAFEWRDNKPGQCDSALPLGVFLGTYRRATLPTPAPLLSEAERKFLAFALDLAFDRMVSDDGFTSEDEAALASLRKLAGGEQP
jgi:hypothetical protein